MLRFARSPCVRKLILRGALTNDLAILRTARPSMTISSRASFASMHQDDGKITKARVVMGDGLRLLNLGATELAMEAYQASLKLFPTPEAMYNIGNIYFQMGKFDDALEFWLKSLSMDAKQPDVLVNLGNLELSVRRDPVKAIQFYERALKLAPEDGEVRFNLAVALDKSNQPQLALGEYQRCKDCLARTASKLHGGDEERSLLEGKISQLDTMIRNVAIRAAASLEKQK